jgi:hypothetical protein
MLEDRVWCDGTKPQARPRRDGKAPRRHGVFRILGGGLLQVPLCSRC